MHRHSSFSRDSSTPVSLRHTNGLNTTRTSKNLVNSPLRKSPSLFKKVSLGWSSFVGRLKSISDEAFAESLWTDELFENDADRFCCVPQVNHLDQKFLADMKTCSTLDDLYDAHHSPRIVVVNESEEMDNVKFRDMDVGKLREEFTTRARTLQLASDSSLETSALGDQDASNVGEMLWEYRRAKWLEPSEGVTKQLLADRHLETSIRHIPRDQYPRIYMVMVEKGRPLKNNTRLNLEDAINIINEGWVHNDKWERAARGVA